MNKKIFTSTVAMVFMMLLTTSITMAKNVSQSKAQAIAVQFFAAHSPKLAKSANESASESVRCKLVNWDSSASSQSFRVVDSDPAYYIFNAVGTEGYVIVSGDDEMPSLLGYSLDGSWPTEACLVPTPLRNALQNYAAYVEDIRQGRVEAPEMHVTSVEAQPVVKPLLTTAWNQCYPYNKYAPMIPDSMLTKPVYCSHYPIGCVAVGIGQVLNYWGQKNANYVRPNTYKTYATWDNWFHDGGKSKTVDTLYYSLSNTTVYDWANIPDSIGYRADTLNVMSQSEWETKGEAVAVFLRDVAYAMNMGWSRIPNHGPGGGAWDQFAPEMVDVVYNFSKEGYTIYTSKTGNQKKLMNLIKADLDKGWPIISDGQDPKVQAGHCYVYDGYDTNDFVHVNWGWGGACNAFYDVNNLNTNIFDQNTKKSASYNWSTDQDVVLCIHPKEEGTVETPKLDNKNVQLIGTGIMSTGNERAAAKAMKSKIIYDGDSVKYTPSVYFDKDNNSLYTEYFAHAYHKSFGYDYDINVDMTNVNNGTVVSNSMQNTKTKELPLSVVGFVRDSIPLRSSLLTDGTYLVSGAIREVLNGQTSDWKNLEAAPDTFLVAGKHIVINPTDYKRLYHGKECQHYCQDSNNRILVHNEFTKDPDNLLPGDSLCLILEIQGIADKNINLDTKADKKVLLTGYVDGQEVPYTIMNLSERIDSCLTKALKGEQCIFSMSYRRMFHAKDSDAGKTYHITFSMPSLNLSMTNDIKIGQGSGVREINNEKSTIRSKSYNTMGMQVHDSYSGIVIRDGRKFVRK